MNVSNYKTPYELWEEKTGVKKPVFQTSEAIEKGNALEPILIELFGVLYKNKFELVDTKDISLSNKKYPFLRANLDGAMLEKETKEKWGLEIKSTTIQNSAMLREWANDHIPITYYFQVLHYMITTGLRHFVLYAILDILGQTMVQENKKQELFIYTMMIWCQMQNTYLKRSCGTGI